MAENQRQPTQEEVDSSIITVHHLRNLGLTVEQQEAFLQDSLKYIDEMEDAGVLQWFKETIETDRRTTTVNEDTQHKIVKKLAETGDYDLVKGYEVFLPPEMSMDFSTKPDDEKVVTLKGAIRPQGEYRIAKRP